MHAYVYDKLTECLASISNTCTITKICCLIGLKRFTQISILFDINVRFNIRFYIEGQPENLQTVVSR